MRSIIFIFRIVFFRFCWYLFYASTVDASWLANLVLWHAVAVATAAASSGTINSFFRSQEVAHFEAVCGNNVPFPVPLCAADDAIVNDATHATNDFSVCLSVCGRHVYDVPALHSRQTEAGRKIIFENKCWGQLLVVNRMGRGKSLILQTIVTCVWGRLRWWLSRCCFSPSISCRGSNGQPR